MAEPINAFGLAACVAFGRVNLIAFLLMGADKRRARRRADGASMRRIPERTLFAWATLGGGIGATAGMLLFRHKTRHWYFRLFLPLLAALQTAAALWLARMG